VAFLPEATVDVHDQLAPVLDAEAGEEPTQVRPNRRHGNVELAGDLLVRMALKKLLNDIRLPRGQREILPQLIPLLLREYSSVHH
jgi:hypothetical protein